MARGCRADRRRRTHTDPVHHHRRRGSSTHDARRRTWPQPRRISRICGRRFIVIAGAVIVIGARGRRSRALLRRLGHVHVAEQAGKFGVEIVICRHRRTLLVVSQLGYIEIVGKRHGAIRDLDGFHLRGIVECRPEIDVDFAVILEFGKLPGRDGHVGGRSRRIAGAAKRGRRQRLGILRRQRGNHVERIFLQGIATHDRVTMRADIPLGFPGSDIGIATRAEPLGCPARGVGMVSGRRIVGTVAESVRSVGRVKFRGRNRAEHAALENRRFVGFRHGWLRRGALIPVIDIHRRRHIGIEALGVDPGQIVFYVLSGSIVLGVDFPRQFILDRFRCGCSFEFVVLSPVHVVEGLFDCRRTCVRLVSALGHRRSIGNCSLGRRIVAEQGVEFIFQVEIGSFGGTVRLALAIFRRGGVHGGNFPFDRLIPFRFGRLIPCERICPKEGRHGCCFVGFFKVGANGGGRSVELVAEVDIVEREFGLFSSTAPAAGTAASSSSPKSTSSKESSGSSSSTAPSAGAAASSSSPKSTSSKETSGSAMTAPAAGAAASSSLPKSTSSKESSSASTRG